MAPTPCVALFPWARRGRARVQRRPGAGPLLAWSAAGRFARRSGRCRLTVAGDREAQAPATRARRAGVCPVRGSRPCCRRGHRRHRHRALAPAPGLAGRADRREAPGVPLRVACEVEPAHTCWRCRAGRHVVLQDNVRRRGGPAPPHGASAGGPDSHWPALGSGSRAAARRLGAVTGPLAEPEGLCPRAAQIAAGCSVDGGDIPRGEVPGAPPPGQWPSVTPSGVDPVARRLGQQGGGDTPAASAFVQQGALEPGAAGARFRDEDALLPLRPQLPSQLLHIALPGADRAAGEDLRAMVVGDVGDRARRFVDLSADRKRARLGHG
jgi:hypothetical protein